MRHFVINVEEQIGKTVGRQGAPDPLRIHPNEIEDAEAWRRSFGGVRIPKGVFRFSSHEEADQWLMTNLAKNAKI
ncbi:MAG: hypothetical protein M3Z22_01555 [Verrucomicrobiota bacterium]|nr:hypothetical protein [Verrucomicrobiota bacterium]